MSIIHIRHDNVPLLHFLLFLSCFAFFCGFSGDVKMRCYETELEGYKERIKDVILKPLCSHLYMDTA